MLVALLCLVTAAPLALSVPSGALAFTGAVLSSGAALPAVVAEGLAAIESEAIEALVNKVKIFFMTRAFRFFVHSSDWECLYNGC